MDFEKETKQPLISVIVPVYNCEKYLKKSLNSLLSQTFTDFEIVCVNDGSTDSSGKILQEYAKKDSRIKVFEQPNGGVSTARNTGLEKACGKYVFFCDSDDTLFPSSLAVMAENMVKYDLDVLYFSYEVEYEDPSYVTVHRKHAISYAKGLPEEVVTGPAFLKRLLDTECYLSMVWLFCYRKEYLDMHDVKFKVMSRHEDEQFTPRAIVYAQRAMAIEDPLYGYFMRSNSLTTTTNTVQRVANCALIGGELMELAESFRASDEERYQAMYDAAARMIYISAYLYKKYVAVNPDPRDVHIGKLKKEKAELQAKLKTSDGKVISLQKDLDSAKTSSKSLSSELSESKTRINSLELSLKDSGARLTKTRKELDSVKEDGARYKRLYDGVKHSVSFRLGRALTWLPRKIRDAFKRK